MRRFLVMATVIVTVFSLVAPAMAQPANDDLAGATPVDALGFEANVDTTEASVEPGEPIEPDEQCPPRIATVWYALTLGEGQRVAVDTAGSNYDTTLAVFTGNDFTDLSLLECNDDTFLGLQAALTFEAAADVTYLIQVGSFGDETSELAGGDLVFSIGETAKATGKPVIFKSQFKGLVAEALVEVFDEGSGAFTSASATVVDGRSSEGGKPSQFSSLFVSSFSETIDEVAQEVTVVDWVGVADLDSDQYHIDKKLRSAWVVADIDLEGTLCTFPFEGGEGTCESLGSVQGSAELSWDGVAGVTKTKFMEKTASDGMRLRFRGTQATRDATVAGAVENGLVLDFSGAFGFISEQSNGDFVMILGLG